MVNDRNMKILVKGVKLVVTPTNDYNASQLLQSTLVPETANNAINPANGRMPYTVNHYLTDTDAWFIKTDVKNGLMFLWRRRNEFTKDNVFDTENAKFKATERYSVGFADWRSIYGNSGA